MKNIQDFVKELIKSKNLENLDAEVVEQMEADLTKRLEDRINAMIMQNIQESDLEEFNNVLDQKEESKTLEFIQSKIPNLEEKTAAILLEFKNIYLG
jgi:ATP phosphoribosyltransferase